MVWADGAQQAREAETAGLETELALCVGARHTECYPRMLLITVSDCSAYQPAVWNSEPAVAFRRAE